MRIFDEVSFAQHRNYIENNPVKRGLVTSPQEYRFGSKHLKLKKRAAIEERASQQGLKAHDAGKALDRHD
ncbi:MAG: hypothetical protein WBE76_17545 [Terracidiphilus sp.]